MTDWTGPGNVTITCASVPIPGGSVHYRFVDENWAEVVDISSSPCPACGVLSIDALPDELKDGNDEW